MCKSKLAANHNNVLGNFCLFNFKAFCTTYDTCLVIPYNRDSYSICTRTDTSVNPLYMIAVCEQNFGCQLVYFTNEGGCIVTKMSELL